MRIGPWWIVGGLALLAAGIISTAGDPLAPQRSRVEQPLAQGDFDKVELGSSWFEGIELSQRRHPAASWMRRPNEGDDASAAVGSRLESGALIVEAPADPYWRAGATLHLPSGTRVLDGQHLAVAAASRVDAVSLRGTYMSWKGDAGTLDVQVDEVSMPCHRRYGKETGFRFNGGRVGALRVKIPRGKVSLADVSGLDTVVLRTGLDVKLELDRISDLGRLVIERIPDDELPPALAPDSKDCGEPAAAALADADLAVGDS